MPFIVSEMTFKGHSKSSAISFFVRSPGLWRDRKSRLYTYFRTKIAEMTLKVDLKVIGHGAIQWAIGHNHFLLVVRSNDVRVIQGSIYSIY